MFNEINIIVSLIVLGENTICFRAGSCCAFKTPNGFINDIGMLDLYLILFKGKNRGYVLLNVLKFTNNIMKQTKRLNTCKKGHQFYKSSECPICPICEKERKPKDNFLSLLGAPARRALENNGITTVEQLSKFSEKEILCFHGMGKSSLPKLQKVLSEKRLSFKP